MATVVEKRSNSRISGATSLETQIVTLFGNFARSNSRTRRLMRIMRIGMQQADRHRADFLGDDLLAISATAASSSGISTSPVTASLSRTV